MIWPTEIHIHDKEPHISRIATQDIWNERQGSKYKHCSYCGSISLQDFYDILKNTDYFIELADQKYGYPHKFYINIPERPGMVKFYTRHLIDITDKETIDEMLKLIKERTKVWLVSHLEDKDE